MELIKRILVRFLGNAKKHIWKETRREDLGSYLDFGRCPQEITKVYRVAVHEECLLSGENRIREVRSLWPAERPLKSS